MLRLNLLLLLLLVVVGVFITGWITPFILLMINRLLLIHTDPFLMLFLCMLAGAIGVFILWHFDEHLHHFLDKKLKLKKHNQMLNKKEWLMRKVSHNIWWKIKLLNNKYLLFVWFICASFSFVPDFVTVDFARAKNYKKFNFLLAMFLWKFVVYAPLIWGSIWFVELFRFVA